MADEPLPSFNQQLRTLKKGKTISVSERYALDNLPEDGINATLSKLRRNIGALVSRQRDEGAGINFRVESGMLVTNDNDAILLVVGITRV